MPSDFSFTSPPQPKPWFNLFSPLPYQFNRIDLPITDLPPDLIGLRIIHISDPHFRKKWSPGWSRIIDDINTSQPHLILMTGDFVDSKTNAGPAMPSVERFFSSLHSRLGNYAIFGNHDHDILYRIAQSVAAQGKIPSEPWPLRKRKDGDGEPTGTPIPPRLPATEFAGHHLLDDRRERIQIGSATLELIGFRGTSRDDFNHEFQKSLPPKSPNTLRIFLSHHPNNIRHLSSTNADIILAGHTHGGQICLPYCRPLMSHDSLPKKMASGIHRVDQSWFIVSRGLGFSSIPLRIFCPPEILEIRLTSP